MFFMLNSSIRRVAFEVMRKVFKERSSHILWDILQRESLCPSKKEEFDWPFEILSRADHCNRSYRHMS